MSNTKKNVLIAVAWPYVNGDIHLGHVAGYLLPADIEARFQHLAGNNVLMVSGSDCYGTPVALEADKRGVTPQDIINEYHPKNIALFKKLNLSFFNKDIKGIYTKTTTDNHKETVQKIFVKLLKEKYIIVDTSEQYYSETEKRFLPDRYVEGECPHCGFLEARSDQCDNCGRLIIQGELKNPISKLTKSPAILKKSQHYFFDWEKSEGFLKDYLNVNNDRNKNQDGLRWRPWIYAESKRWLDNGLKARAITRDLDWGIEIPVEEIKNEGLELIEGYEHKRIYVWFEAVIGYLSASKELLPKEWGSFWHNDSGNDLLHYYFMGKDNLVFHTLFWPSQLHAYDKNLHLPNIQAINQFLTLNNKGFSKSRGITIDPGEMVDKYGLDIIRFYLTLIMPEYSDSDFNHEDFIVKTNNLLIANLGNFIYRTLKLAEKEVFQGKEYKNAPVIIKKYLTTKPENYQDFEYYPDAGYFLLNSCRFRAQAENILNLSSLGNFYLSRGDFAETENNIRVEIQGTPWKLKETDHEQYNEIMFGAIAITVALTMMMKPIIPDTAEKLEQMLSIKIDHWLSTDEIIEKAKSVIVKNPEPLFKKIEADPDKENFNEKYQ